MVASLTMVIMDLVSTLDLWASTMAVATSVGMAYLPRPSGRTTWIIQGPNICTIRYGS